MAVRSLFFPNKKDTKCISLVKIFAQEVEAMTPQLADILIIKYHGNVGSQIRRNLTRSKVRFTTSLNRAPRHFFDRMWRHLLLDDSDTIFGPAPARALDREETL